MMLTFVLSLCVSQVHAPIQESMTDRLEIIRETMPDIFEFFENLFEGFMEHLSPRPVPVREEVQDIMSVALVIDGVTREQLLKIMPGISRMLVDTYLPLLNAAMREFEINTPLRIAAFLGQVAHESAELKYFQEIADGSAYESRNDLGNVFPGDGKRFKGRGPIQLTGRSNYRDYGQVLGLDLVHNPELAASPEVGFRIAGAFWKRKSLNALADNGEYKRISIKINGINKKTGEANGIEDRIKYYTLAKEALGVK